MWVSHWALNGLLFFLSMLLLKNILEYFKSFFLKLICREIEYFFGFIGFITVDTALFAYLFTKCLHCVLCVLGADGLGGTFLEGP